MGAIVSNPSADGPEKIERAAKILRASKQAKVVFRFVYGSKRWRTMREMRESIPGFNTNISIQAARLAAEDIIEKRGSGHNLAYGKKDFYNHNKAKILRLSENLSRLKKYPTKRKQGVQAVVKTYSFRSKPQAELVTIDSIESFKAAWKVKFADTKGLKDLPERTVNRAICTILNQSEKKDWGGERNDIYSNNLIFKGKRKAGAFALKGRATKGILTPNKMGKKADQVQRLFEGTAEFHFVVHHSDIDERVLDQMEAQAIYKSAGKGKKIYYCPIDGKDLARLRAAYPKAFNL